MSSPYAEAYAQAKAIATGSGGPKPLVQYQRDPAGYLVDVLGVRRETVAWSANPGYTGHQWDGTPDPIALACTALAEWRDVGIESATGTGKSYLAAGLLLWFLACWEDARVFTFGAKEDQLRLYIWTELRKLFPAFQRHFPSAVLTDLSLRVRGGLDDSWAAHGYAVGVRAGEDVAAKAAGMHAAHMLLIYEETQGIAQPVIEAGSNTATAPHNLRLFLGNPDHQLDTLHMACTLPGVEHIRISALDHPNVVTGDEVVPGAVSRKAVSRRLAQYGETHRLYQSRVRGVSPAESAEALIRLEWIQRSFARWREAKENGTLEKWGKPALGVDVANSEHGDEAALAFGRGRVLLTVESFACPDANKLGWRVAKVADRDGISVREIGVDTVGVGAGCYNELARLGKVVRSLQGGPEYDYGSEEEFLNLRCQMWWRMAEDLRLDRVDLCPDDQLATDLVTPRWEPKRGKIVVEPKEEIKKRLPSGRSPNRGDSVVYWNHVRDRSPVASPLPDEGRIRHGDHEVFRGTPEIRRDVDPAIPDGADSRDFLPGTVSEGSGF